MIVWVSQKEKLDEYQAAVDVSERAYLKYFMNAKLFPDDTVFLPVPSHLEHLDRMFAHLPFDFLILAGGNNLDPAAFGNDEEMDDLVPLRDEVERRLFEHARAKNLPVLGICRGAQWINVLLGGQMSLHLQNHPPGVSHPCQLGDRVFHVNSYHEHGMRPGDLSAELEPLAWADEGKMVEAFRGRTGRLLGVQWHPERPHTDEACFRILFEECFGCL